MAIVIKNKYSLVNCTGMRTEQILPFLPTHTVSRVQPESIEIYQLTMNNKAH
jgi:hypothetical protein